MHAEHAIRPSLPAELLVAQVKAGTAAAAARPALAPTSSHNVQPKQASARVLEDIYRKMTPLEHILARPDTYIGSVEKQEKGLWVHTGDGMAERKIDFAPGLYKIFDEASSCFATSLAKRRRKGTVHGILCLLFTYSNKHHACNAGTHFVTNCIRADVVTSFLRIPPGYVIYLLELADDMRYTLQPHCRVARSV
jgi:hypothetical protein